MFAWSGNPPPPERKQDWHPEISFCRQTWVKYCPTVLRTEPPVLLLQYVSECSRSCIQFPPTPPPIVDLKYLQITNIRQYILNSKGLLLLPWVLKPLCSLILRFPPQDIIFPLFVIHRIFATDTFYDHTWKITLYDLHTICVCRNGEGGGGSHSKLVGCQFPLLQIYFYFGNFMHMRDH